jgi:5-formaminoimidazole-4-carboxamide-1-beta-D-ribofuranosyl 5'-monophosphate synthetase
VVDVPKKRKRVVVVEDFDYFEEEQIQEMSDDEEYEFIPKRSFISEPHSTA